MIPMPSPIHPAIVHLPIVLILIGTMVAVAAVFVRRWHLPWLAAGLLLTGAAGAVAATWTGGNEQEIVGNISEQAEQILDQHEEWAERTRNVSILAALLAIGAAGVSRFPVTRKTLAVAAALVALSASYCVAATGHYGGQLVYKHGVGINTAAGSSTAVPLAPKARPKGEETDDD